MGHYAALVIHRSGQTVDELLAPYDQNLEFPEREVPCSCIGLRVHRDETTPGARRHITQSADASPDPHCDLCQGTGRFLTTGNPNGQWDWYLIGGQFSGALTGYKAWEDRDNWQVCHYCQGTGQRTDMDLPNGCNGCGGTGRAQKHVSDWKPYRGDTLRVVGFLSHPPDFVPSAVIAPTGEWHEEGLVSRYAASIECLEEKKLRLRGLLALYPDCLATVVDCHF